MKIKHLAVAVVAALALMSQASFAQTVGAGARDASGAATGGVAATTVVIGVVFAGVIISAANSGGSNPTTGTTGTTGTTP